jgi:hypothetical protein
MTAIPAPESGAEIRMYRAGHGDCFLLTFRKTNGDPFHMLLDCGMKGGSETIETMSLSDILTEIHETTGGVLDLVAVTHEHEDHVSGFPDPDDADHPFQAFRVLRLWLAWTEDDADQDANRFREMYGDQLLTLALAHHRLTQTPGADGALLEELADFITLETGHTTGLAVLEEIAIQVPKDARGPSFGLDAGDDAFSAVMGAAKKVKGLRYKRRLMGLRDKAEETIFLSPGDGPLALPDVPGVRVYPFGPPRDLGLLKSLDPHKHEEFHAASFAAGLPGAEVFAALSGSLGGASGAPFSVEHTIPEDEVLGPKPIRKGDMHGYLRRYAFKKNAPRRIDGDWVRDAQSLALRINNDVNNTSLVLGIELVCSGKLLFFTGDAQRGSWKSWADLSWDVEGAQVTAKDLLARCTFYKVGHHGSHNATLAGTVDDDHANLDWMAQGAYADAFVAMIPTHKDWAFKKKPWPWQHPLAAIEDALYTKAKSRVMMIQHKGPEWRAPWDGPASVAMRETFDAHTKVTDSCITHRILDEPL